MGVVVIDLLDEDTGRVVVPASETEPLHDERPSGDDTVDGNDDRWNMP